MPTMALRAPARWAVLLVVLLVPGLSADGQSNIVFDMVGRVPGANYSAAGLRIRYRYRGRVYSLIAWSAAVACVTTVFSRSPACPDIGDRIQAKAEQTAVGSS